LPAKPKFAEGWQLVSRTSSHGRRKPYALPASGSETTGILYFARPSIARAGWTPSRFARATSAWCITPNVLVDRQQNGRRQEIDPGAGFGGMELTIESEFLIPIATFILETWLDSLCGT